MNIVYGVSGEGLGHVFEAIEIGRILKADGHQLKMLTFGERACASLAEFEPTRIEGIHLCFDESGLSLSLTFRKNICFFPFFLANTRRLMREIRAFQPDAFITAYEPFTTLASHWLRKPLISMDNQNELRDLPPPRGANAFAFHLARLTTRVVTCGAQDYIVKSFDRRGLVSGRRHLVAPIIQGEIRRIRPTTGSHVLVYLTKPNPELIEVLKSMDETFVVYCHNRVGEEKNITYRAQGPGFLADLAGCKAVIGTAGFSLIADSIFLRKPYFAVPLRKQFEQTHNAAFLEKSGLGESSETVSRERLSRFLARLPHYRERLGRRDFDPAEQEETLRGLLAKIGAGCAADAEGGVTATFPGTGEAEAGRR
jgi:uncharacterized protein (TIGR00661 family)